MNKKIYCFYQDKRGEWKRATQEMFNRANIVWKLYPYKQFHTEIINKNAMKLWELFDECLSHTRKDYYNDPSGVYINGQQTPIAFGSNLSCEKLNNRYEVEWKPYKCLRDLYKPEGEYNYEFKMKNGETIYGYYLDEETEINKPYGEVQILPIGLYVLNGGIDQEGIDDSKIEKYRLIEKYMNLPKCAYKDYAEGCCNNCPFIGKPGCRTNEWDKIQYEEAMNEERMRQEAMEDAMRDELMRNNYDADYGDVRY